MGIMDKMDDMKKKAHESDLDDKAMDKLKEMRRKKNQDEVSDQA